MYECFFEEHIGLDYVHECAGSQRVYSLAMLHSLQVSGPIPDLASAGLKSFERQLRFLARLGEISLEICVILWDIFLCFSEYFIDL